MSQERSGSAFLMLRECHVRSFRSKGREEMHARGTVLKDQTMNHRGQLCTIPLVTVRAPPCSCRQDLAQPKSSFFLRYFHVHTTLAGDCLSCCFVDQGNPSYPNPQTGVAGDPMLRTHSQRLCSPGFPSFGYLAGAGEPSTQVPSLSPGSPASFPAPRS